jgi:ABC-type dipeptide/oligopeptide/nickel transport system permease component
MRLWIYIVRRLLILIPTLIGVTLITFALSHAGGPNVALRPYCSNKILPCDISNPRYAGIVAYLHLNDPLPVQYVFYLRALFQGDWGFTSSVLGGVPVADAIVVLFPATVELAVTATIAAIVLGIPTGTISATRKDKLPDHISRVVALSGFAIPYFWLAIMLQLIAISLIPTWPIAGEYTPSMLEPCSSTWAFIIPSGSSCASGNAILFSQPTHFFIVDAAVNGDWTIFWNGVAHIVLPTLTLGFGIFGVILRMIRSGMVDAMSQDYVRTANAKGLPEEVVIRKHIRRNALLPATTVVGLLFAGLLGGVVLVEDVFQWPGIGNWTVQSVITHDAGGVMGTTLLFALFLMLTNLVVDVVYAYLDPRISL